MEPIYNDEELIVEQILEREKDHDNNNTITCNVGQRYSFLEICAFVRDPVKHQFRQYLKNCLGSNCRNSDIETVIDALIRANRNAQDFDWESTRGDNVIQSRHRKWVYLFDPQQIHIHGHLRYPLVESFFVNRLQEMGVYIPENYRVWALDMDDF